MDSFQPINKFIDINRIRLHYLDWGNPDRQPVLLLHGFTAHARSWDRTAEILRERFHVLALDQRGHGRSSNAENISYSIDEHFTDISIFIEMLGLKDLVLIGHSMGGRNALFYAACMPDNVSQLVLVDARPGNSTGASTALKEHLAVLPLEVETLDEAVQVIRDIYPRIPEDDCYDLASYGYKKTDTGLYETRFDSRMLNHTQKAGFSAESLWHFMDNVKCPTLIIRGKESDFLSIEDAREMKEKIPGAILIEIPDASHMPAQENRDVFCHAVLDFLKDHGNV